MKTCTSDGCDKPLRARGLCSTHYNQTHQPNRHRKVTTTCDYCGTAYEEEPTRKKRYGRTYCTSECRDTRRRSPYRQIAVRSRSTLAAKLSMIATLHAQEQPHEGWVSGRCKVCGAWWLGRLNNWAATTCSTACATTYRRMQRRETKDRRRARQRSAYVAPVYRAEVFERDGYTCQLCGGRLAMHKPAPHPESPTIDHIIPLARGGTHEPANVQAARFLCNSTKSDRMEAPAAA